MYLMDNNKNNFCAIDEDDSMKDELRAKSVYIDRSRNISIMYIILVSYDYFQELNNKIRN